MSAEIPNEFREAVQLIAEARDARSPNREARETAAKALLDGLVKACQAAGLRAGYHDGLDSLFITTGPNRPIFMAYGGGAFRFQLTESGANQTELTLPFDPVAKVFVTNEPDDRLTPVPGEPRPMKHPSALLARAIVELDKKAP